MEIAAIIFILVMAAIAYVVFRLLKKAVKMAIRAIVVMVILLIAIVGGIALWSMDGNNSSSKRPIKTKNIR